MARNAIQRAIERQAAAMQLAKAADNKVTRLPVAETARVTESAGRQEPTWKDKLAGLEDEIRSEQTGTYERPTGVQETTVNEDRASQEENKVKEDTSSMTETTELPQDAEAAEATQTDVPDGMAAITERAQDDGFAQTVVLTKKAGLEKDSPVKDDPRLAETTVLPEGAWVMGVVEAIHELETDLERQARQSFEADMGVTVPEPAGTIEAEFIKPDSVADEAGAKDESAAVSIDISEVEDAIASLADEPDSMLEALYEKFDGREAALPGILGELFGYPAAGSRQIMSLEANVALLNLNQSRDRQCVIVGESSSPTVLFCNPFDQELRSWLESMVQADLHWILVSPGDLNAYISRKEQGTKAMDSVVQLTGGNVDAGHELDALSLASISQDSSPVVKLVHSTLYDALRAGASDIHIETGNAALEIRYRIDGVLMHVASVAGADIAEQVISRVKVMSELDIAERRIPQDGRFKSAYDGRPIDFRVSIMPSSFGEDAVLRVLDKQAVTAQMTELTLSSLGFADSMISALRKLSDRPYGMLLVTGPTGSGKTTTLYAALSETNSGAGKVVTIEDPVEYELPGVLQIPVNEKKGLTFARGLRSILRHDPDKIMVGEIRDPETAQIAIQSALTGHLVFTTVHANNVFDVLSRFTHMGVDPYSFVSALNGILAQRLLRVVCSKCAEKIVPTTAMLEATGEPLEVARTFNWRVGRGCSDCRGTGYKGRKAVGELLVLSDELREAIVERVPVRRLKELARKEGLKSINSAAMDMVREGLTTIEEVNRVTTMA